MTKISRLYNKELIEWTANHTWSLIRPINSPDTWTYSNHTYLGIFKDSVYYGMYQLILTNPQVVEIHSFLLPSAKGPIAKESAENIIRHVFNIFEAPVIWTMTCKDNRLACRYIENAGFKQTGVLPMGFKYADNRISDVVYYSLLRKDAKWLQ